MTRLRFTLLQLMAVVLLLGFGLAALRNADEFWASATYTLAIGCLALALVGIIAYHGRARMPWVGFAVFGWTYLILVHFQTWSSFPPFSFGPVSKPPPLTEWGTTQLVQHMSAIRWPGSGGFNLHPTYYTQVSRSLGIILFGLVGAVSGRILAARGDRPSS